MRFGSRIVGHDGVIRHGKENRKQRRMLVRTDCCAGAQRGVREAALWATADYGTVLLLLAEAAGRAGADAIRIGGNREPFGRKLPQMLFWNWCWRPASGCGSGLA